jgi:hypothetical protein
VRAGGTSNEASPTVRAISELLRGGVQPTVRMAANAAMIRQAQIEPTSLVIGATSPGHGGRSGARRCAQANSSGVGHVGVAHPVGRSYRPVIRGAMCIMLRQRRRFALGDNQMPRSSTLMREGHSPVLAGLRLNRRS